MKRPTDSRQILFSGYWNNHRVEIEESGNYRSLYFGDRSLQSTMSLTMPDQLVLPYTRYMTLALLINSSPLNILVVGVGSGSFIRFFHHHFSGCHIDAVDYSPEVIQVARDYFQLPDNERISMHCADGQSFLQHNCDTLYDLVLVDAFDDQGMAPTVYSDFFFSLCARSLRPDGLLSCNLWSDDRRRLQEIKDSLADHFDSCLYLPVPDRGNIIAIALPFATPWQRICLKKKQLALLSRQYDIDFHRIVQIAKQNNLSLSKRISSWLGE